MVHFLDADLSQYRLNDKKYGKHRTESVNATRAMLVDDKAGNYRNVAFRLSAAVAARLEALPIRTP